MNFPARTAKASALGLEESTVMSFALRTTNSGLDLEMSGTKLVQDTKSKEHNVRISLFIFSIFTFVEFFWDSTFHI